MPLLCKQYVYIHSKVVYVEDSKQKQIIFEDGGSGQLVPWLAS
jgi:hypothetical protein